ncbi:hypothetical protein BN2127_JRS1_00377 [Bacillus cereus]|nr:hypothetical protein BN2127_JRS1_00377 [Bacillus cereus]
MNIRESKLPGIGYKFKIVTKESKNVYKFLSGIRRRAKF